MDNAVYSLALTLALVVLAAQAPAIQAVAKQTHIVGGSNAATNSAPFIVSMQQELTTGNVHYCGGTIINANWVLSAAHCLESRSVVANTVMIAGSLSVSGTASTTQRRKIDYVVIHELYTGGTAPYDIGLAYTKTAFKWTSAVRAAQLPKAGVMPTGTATLYGWGSISTTTIAKYPKDLQVTSVPIIVMSQCETALGAGAIYLHDTNLCTGPLNGGVGICTSDSGGPLMQSKTLIGVISWGKTPCGQKNSPSVYVRVSAFNTWIKKHQVAPK